MFCNKCGCAVPDGTRCCQRCGAVLPVLTYQRGGGRPSGPGSRKSPPIPEPGRKRRGKAGRTPAAGWRLLAGAVIALLLVSALAGLYFYSGAAVKGKAGSVYYLETYDAEGGLLGQGSGFVIGDGTDIATNYHVIRGAAKIVAYSADKTESVTLTSVAAYSVQKDLAVLHAPSGFAAPPLALADSDRVRQGDRIYVIGYPLGVANTLSEGIVSASHAEDEEEGMEDMLLITAAISPGSSGGALFNQWGQVEGVIKGHYVNGQNLNMVIPSNELQDLYGRRGELLKLADVSIY